MKIALKKFQTTNFKKQDKKKIFFTQKINKINKFQVNKSIFYNQQYHHTPYYTH